MKRKSFAEMDCPIARALEVVGDWWTPLILREIVLNGPQKFQDLERNLGIAPAVLSNRLNDLIDNDLLERRQYSEHPERFEYIATSASQDFEAVLDELKRWGTKWTTSSPG
ncbi:MAG: helix-turn-helix domain-containing protein [Actinomycetota bacterium]|jgi:DNA-binding HxlR family transcriptional regulator|nr:helix-turn-helix transcriptional regulator [Acidimicrobiales bacterium]MED5540517.1 helix-turn-helix domain-containing protein [Actinomycetota bacterium]MEE2805943.1 helix-turn-helix domain-containing protein [Actinomycetota bacterium]|tara:strand:- start:2760 stop:3092 length:333 start_codon:yes stop_codon:yes gene_type:complete